MRNLTKITALLLAVIMLMGILPMDMMFAAEVPGETTPASSSESADDKSSPESADDKLSPENSLGESITEESSPEPINQGSINEELSLEPRTLEEIEEEVSTMKLVEPDELSEKELENLLAEPLLGDAEEFEVRQAVEDELPSALDGSNIETLVVQWRTADSVENGDDELLHQMWTTNETQSVQMRLIFALSGQHDYNEGTVQIKVPKQIFRNRSDDLVGNLSLAVPEAPDRNALFAYTDMGDHYLIVNNKKMSAASSGMIEATMTGLIPSQIRDLSVGYETDPFFAEMTVLTTEGNLIGRTSNEITAEIETKAVINNASKRHGGVVMSGYPATWPAELEPENSEDYYYVQWSTHAYSNGNQPFSVSMRDNARANNDARNAIILGIRDVRKNVVIPGDGSGDLSLEMVTDTYLNDGQNFFATIYTAYPKEDFPENKEYNLRNEVTYTLTSTDDKEVTTTTDSASIPFAPLRTTLPNGHFIIHKTGNGIYDTALNKLDKGKEVDVTYNIRAIGYGAPWTIEPGADPEVLSSYNKRHYTMVAEDYFTSFAGGGEMTSEGFEFKSLLINKPLVEEFFTFEQTGTVDNDYTGTVFAVNSRPLFGYRRTADSRIPELLVEARISGGEFIPVGTVNFTTGAAVITPENGASVSGANLIFPENVTDYKVTAQTLESHLEWTMVPTVTIKPSAKNLALVREVLEFEDTLSPRLPTDNIVKLDAYVYDSTQHLPINEALGRNVLTGFAYGVKNEKSATWTSDKSNQLINLTYTTRTRIQTNVRNLTGLNEAISEGLYTPETKGVFYDLLPQGVVPDVASVRLRPGDTLLNVTTTENYKGTGRTLLTVEAELSPVYSYDGRTGTILGEPGMYDEPRMSFNATYSWYFMTELGNRLRNVVAYESGNESIGSVLGLQGEPDDPRGGRNNYSQYLLGEDNKDALTDLNPNHDNESFVYAGVDTVINTDIYTLASLSKVLDVNDELNQGDGLLNESPKNVYEGAPYSYYITLRNTALAKTTDLIFYDNLESYVPTEDKDDHGDVQWRGFFRGIDTSDMRRKGANAKVYYSTREDLILHDTDDRAHNNLDDTSIWSLTPPSNLEDVRAIAVDAREGVNGEAFVLSEEESIFFRIDMRAPYASDLASGEEEPSWYYDTELQEEVTEDGETLLESEAGFIGGAHAYNNAVLINTTISVLNGNRSEHELIRHDYTKVGLKPFEVHVTKTFDDDNNRDGIRPDEVTIYLLRNGEETGESVILNAENNWEHTFQNIPYMDINGRPFVYTVREEPVNGYIFNPGASTLQDDRLTFNMTNVHEPERIDIRGEKVWDDDEIITRRPESIRVTLLKNGINYRTITVRPDVNGAWKFSFSNLFKYENGEEITYTIKETDYITGYVGEITDFDIVNRYDPYGILHLEKDVVGMTEAALALDPVFEFTFYMRDSEGELLTKTYDYVTNLGREGTISTGGILTLSPYEVATILNVDSDLIYEFVETDMPEGFSYNVRLSENMRGTLIAGEEKDVRAVNNYDTSGSTLLEVSKTLTGRALRPFEFMFDLYDEEGNILKSAANGVSGSIQFGSLSYGLEDVGKTYTYTIRERNTGRGGIVYDDHEEVFTVFVRDNGDGMITPEVNYDEDGAVFENRYEAEGSVSLRAYKQVGSGFEMSANPAKETLVRFSVSEGAAPDNFYLIGEEGRHSFVLPESEKPWINGGNEFDGGTEIFYNVDTEGNATFENQELVVENGVLSFEEKIEPGRIMLRYEDNGRTIVMYPENGVVGKSINKEFYWEDGTILTKADEWSPYIPTDIDTFKTEGKLILEGSISYMFELSQATSLDLSSFDTSNVTDMSGMFSWSQAQSLDLSSFDTSNVTDMSYMFDSSQATSLDLSNFDTSSVTDMSGMFSDLPATSLDLSNFDTSNVTDMSSMFSWSQAQSLDLSSFDTSNVTSMNGMFLGSQATSLNLSSFDTSNVTDMSHMFALSQATILDLSSFDTSNVTVTSFWGFDSIFRESKATTGYARTQADADRFNTFSPPTLTFVVKESNSQNILFRALSAVTSSVRSLFSQSEEEELIQVANATGIATETFDFELIDKATGRIVGRAQNDSQGVITFPTLNFTQEDVGKTFTYVAREVFGDNPDIIYDRTSVEYDVTVYDNGNGTLSFDVSTRDMYTGDIGNATNSPVFVNKYHDGGLSIQKEIISGDLNKEFDFKVVFSGDESLIPSGAFELTREAARATNMVVFEVYEGVAPDTVFLESADGEHSFVLPEGTWLFGDKVYNGGDTVKYSVVNGEVTFEDGVLVIENGVLSFEEKIEPGRIMLRYEDNERTLVMYPENGVVGKSIDQEFYWEDGTILTKADEWSPYIPTDIDTFKTEGKLILEGDLSGMFMYSQATSLDLSSFNTLNVTNMSYMFAGSQATSLDLSNFNTSNVTDMSFMFGESQATSLDLSSFDTSNVTNMSYMFIFSQATSLDLSNFDTSSVEDMSGMFMYSQATSLDLSNFDTSNVTNMLCMFMYSQATSLDLSSFDTSNVTNMSQMFEDSEATSLNLSNFDTSSVEDMISMFTYSQATSLDLSSFDTSNVTNMSQMFQGSEAISLDLSNFDTSSVRNMSRMFSNSQATSLNLSIFNTSNVTDMRGMFSNSQATSLDLSSFDTSNVEDMSNMFAGLQTTNLDLSNFDTSSVWSMSYMFAGSQATGLDLSNFNTSNVTNMSRMFSNSQATSLDLSSFDTSNVTDMSEMFRNSQATSLDLSSFDTLNVTNMSYMFDYSQATSLDLSSFDTSSVTNMSYMFKNSQATIGYARTQAEVDRFNDEIMTDKPPTLTFVVKGSSAQNTLEESKEESLLVKVLDFLIPKSYAADVVKYTGTQGGVTWTIYEDGELVFSPTNGVEGTFNDMSSRPWSAYEGQYNSVRFEPGVKGGSSLSRMFQNSQATSLDLSNFDTSNVRDMSYMFWQSLATSLDLSNFDTSNVTNMRSMFSNLQATSLDLSNFDTSSVTSMYDMFYKSQATSLDLSSFDTSSVTNMSGMFMYSQATSLDLSSFNTLNVTNMSYMFSGSQATSLDLSNFDTSSVMYMNYMFRDSEATSLELSNFDTSSVRDMSYMFWQSRATSLDLSSFDTSSVTNMREMFSYSQARSLDLGPNFKWVGTNANLPPAASTVYTGKWIREDKTYGPYTPEELYSAYNANQAAYAGTWIREKVSHKVSFNMGDTSVIGTPLDTISVDINGSFTVPTPEWSLNKNNFEYTLVNFKGSDGKTYKIGQSYTISGTTTQTITLTGVWEVNQYRLKYDLNGANGAISDSLITVGDTVTLPNPPSRVPGKQFAGWLLNGQPVTATTNIIPAGTDATLVANWVDVDNSINIENGEFEFSLFPGEKVTLPDLPAGLNYQVYEETEDGWILVSENNTSGVIEPNKTSDARFINDYQPGVTQEQFSGVKYLDENPSGGFSFELYEGTTLIDTATSLANGEFSFNSISYREPGAYTYTIKEVQGSDGGILYDDTEYTVIVIVTDNGDGTMSSSVTYPEAGVVFNNESVLSDLVLSKEVLGLENSNVEFTLEVTLGLNDIRTVTIKDGESVRISDIPFGTSYSVRELNIPDGFSLVSIVDSTGVIGDTDVEILVTNSYDTFGSFMLEAKKELTGKDLVSGEFTFELLDSEGNVIDTAGNDGEGNIYFNSISVDAPGEYTYQIREVKGEDANMTYDESVKDVVVVATDNGDGSLSSEVSYRNGNTFVNTFEPTVVEEEEGTGNVSITKQVVGTDADRSFDVEVSLLDAEGNPLVSRYPYTTSRGREGSVLHGETLSIYGGETITVTLLPEGASVMITEDVPEGYRLGETSVTEGIVQVDETVMLNLTNYYDAQGELQLNATKVLKGASLDNYLFEFLLLQDGQILETVQNDSEGNIRFSSIFFTLSDVGKTFTYEIVEDKGIAQNISYDDSYYELTVTPSDNGDGTISLNEVLTRNGEEVTGIEFVNERLKSSILLTKTENFSNTPIDSVTFELLSEDKTEVLATGVTDENGEILFDNLDPGVYFVRETKTKEGYRLPLNPDTRVQIFEDDLVVRVNVSNFSQMLPSTGLFGTVMITLVLLGFSVIGVLLYMRKKESY